MLVVLIFIFVSGSPTFYPAAAWGLPYDRKEFPHWSDLDRDGLNTRQELLLKRRHGKVWVCPYTGFTSSDPDDFEVDHIVSLKQAWDLGAEHWTKKERENFANDEDNLELVKSQVNSAKRSLWLSEWLPLNLAYFPVLVSKYNLVCNRYMLGCPDPDPSGLAEIIRMLNGLRYPDAARAFYPSVQY